MIHSLGIKSVPGDESSNGCCVDPHKSAVEPVPSIALALYLPFSTRLFCLFLILASTSAIRRHMLDAAGVGHRAMTPDVDEDAVKVRFSDAADIATALAAAKAQSIGGDQWVIGSDSVVSVDDRLFDKPRDREEAAGHLRFFS